MGAPSGRSDNSLIKRLETEPQRFTFFQAVRLLLQLADAEAEDGQSAEIGGIASPRAEPVQISTTLSMAFPGSVVSVIETESRAEGRPRRRLGVSFFGLAGAAGVLPNHYTRLAIDRVRRGNEAFRNFLDLFNHRAASFFYRAWEKHRLAVGYERAAARRESREDTLTQCLFSIIGLGTAALSGTAKRSSALRGRLAVSDETLLYYAGLFSHRPRSFAALTHLLQDYTGHPIRIHQFHGQWLRLSNSDQSCLPTTARPLGVNCRLGETAMIGARTWTGESGFRVGLGPLTWKNFQMLLPGQKSLREISELTGMFAGTHYDFDIQPVLLASEIPAASLAGDARLGWNTWMLSRPRQRDGDEAVFRPEGALIPSAKSVG